MNFKKLNFSIIITILLLLNSCYPKKKLNYIGSDDKLAKTVYENIRAPKTIQPHDYLYIRVFSLDPSVSDIFQNRQNSVGGDIKLYSYQVNENGEINFPFIGDIDVSDLTINEAQIKIEELLSEYLSNISVTVRFIGNKLTILGEVNRPGSFQYFDDKINVFEAVGLANGINTYGNKSKVIIIRETKNKTEYHEIDLTTKKIAASEYYYLLPNDIVIVTPIRAKYRTYRDLSLYSTLLSTITTLVTVLYFFNRGQN